MSQEQLRIYIQEINNGLEGLVQLLTTSRRNKLLKVQQSVKDVEAQISELMEQGMQIVMARDNLKQELRLTQQRMTEMEGRTPGCDHWDLEKNVGHLEGQFRARAPALTDLAGDQEDA
jgi:septal ring factor EnvC (AmiA/AmiB activator)